MMIYELSYGGKNYEMMPFSFDVENRMSKAKNPRQKYDFLKQVIGETAILESLGAFNTCDPNVLFIMFNTAVAEYRRPIIEKTAEQTEEALNKVDFEKLEKLGRLADKL